MKHLIKYYKDFEEKYSSIAEFDADWYMDNFGVMAYCNRAKSRDVKESFSEEWYRARFVYLMINSGYYPKENICVEFSLPKGNGGKAIKPDIVVFRSGSWKKWFEQGDYERLRKNILVIIEIKNSSNDVEKAIQRQIEVALERRLSTPELEDFAYGIYVDNKDDIVVLKKEGLAELERYDIKKMILARKDIDRLNVALRDDLSELPTYVQLERNVSKITKKYEFMYDDLIPLGEKGFQNILDNLQREKDKLKVFKTKELLVEALALKVFDEKNIKETSQYSSFYISDDEINENGAAKQTFRKRIDEMYKKAEEMYRILSERRSFRYKKSNKTNDLTPLNGDDEKMFISIVKAFQGKSILEGTSQNFNQTIFNNFGSEAEKNVAGQFFTPIQIINGIVDIMNPRQRETVVDPCSGICDFLAMAWRHSNSQGDALNYYGFDISDEVLKLAELNLVLNGDGNAKIYKCNTIFEKLCENSKVTDINSFTSDFYNIYDWTNKDDPRQNIKKYECVMTNPPFGKGRDLKTGKDGIWDYGLSKSNMSMYETWSILGEPNSIDMGIIFLENAYKMTEYGGRFSIVLSNSLVSIPSWSKIREWLMDKVRIVAILDMPQSSFGDTPVATTVIIAYKPKEDECHLLENNYEVFIKEIEYTGYEVKKVKRNIVFEPIKLLDELTYEDTGKLREDFTETLYEFNEYMKRQEKPVKIAFGRD